MRLIVLFVTAACAVALPQRTLRIVGGNSTTIQQYPFMSNMQYSLSSTWWSHSCGGTLITSGTVLSAAHCYYLDSPLSWQVLLGSSSITGGSTYKVSELIWHPNYNSATLENDVAIVKLQTNAVMSRTVGAARISGARYGISDGDVAYAVGWGTLSSGGELPEQLQHVSVNIINQDVCAKRYAYLRTQPGYEDWPEVESGMICAGALDIGGKDTCQGDSGGPLVHNKDIIIGITSWGYRCGDPRYPGVNTRVSAYTNWILKNA